MRVRGGYGDGGDASVGVSYMSSTGAQACHEQGAMKYHYSEKCMLYGGFACELWLTLRIDCPLLFIKVMGRSKPTDLPR